MEGSKVGDLERKKRGSWKAERDKVGMMAGSDWVWGSDSGGEEEVDAMALIGVEEKLQ